jgi:hypothetical protein
VSVLSGPETIKGHLDSLVEYLQAGNADEARMRAHQALFDLQRLRANVPDRTKGGSGFMIAAVQLGMDLGKIRDLDASIHSVINLLNSDQIEAALEACQTAREQWLAPKEE